MSMSVQKISQIFRTYRSQERIAELNKQNNLRTVQTQSDRVTISAKAREQQNAQSSEVARIGSPAPVSSQTLSPATPSASSTATKLDDASLV